MKRLFRNKKFLGATSLVLVTSLVVGTMAFKRSNKEKGLKSLYVPQVAADAGVSDFDSASLVNYSTILERAVNYGIVSGEELHLVGHMETTFATKLYRINADKNCDVDLAGAEPAQFIIADIAPGSKAIFGQTYIGGDGMKFVFDTTKELVENNRFQYNTDFKGVPVYRTYEKADLELSIDTMLVNIKRQSDTMLTKNAFDGDKIAAFSDGEHATIDLTDPSYKDATIYINVPGDSKLQNVIGTTGGLTIKKDPSTVVVFNLLTDGYTKMSKYRVETAGKQIDTDTTCKGDDSDHNKDVDKYIARSIIWNIPNASSVDYDITAGLFLVPNPRTTGNVVGSSAGWIAAAGKTIVTDGEFHYIYHDREDFEIDNGESDLHFAARKAFTQNKTGVPEEDNSIQLSAGDYTFTFQETESDYQKTIGTATTVKNDAFSKITFPTLKYKASDIDPVVGETHYYVIKELKKEDGLDNVLLSDGEIDIQVDITNFNGNIHFVVTTKMYLSAEDKAAGNAYGGEDHKDMSGAEFSLGAFFNEVKKDQKASLQLTKTLDGEDPNKTYKVAVKKGQQYVQDYNGTLKTKEHYFELSKDRTIQISDLKPGEYTIVEEEGDIRGYSLTATTISVDGAQTSLDANSDYPTATIALNNQDNKNVVINNTYEKADLDNTTQITVTKKITIDDQEPSTIPDAFAGKKIQFALRDNNSNQYIVDTNGKTSTTKQYLSVGIGESLTIYGLKLNTLYVIEENGQSAEVPGYSVTFTGPQVLTSSNPNENRDVSLENKYTRQKNNLEIRKYFYNQNNNDILNQIGGLDNLSFTVTGPDDFTTVTLSWADFTNGVKRFENVPVGEYTITETGGDKTGSDSYVFKEYTVKTQSPVKQYETGVYIITNTYDQVYKQRVEIIKNVEGLDPSYADKEYEIAIINSKGEYYTERNGTVTFETTPYYIKVRAGYQNRFVSELIPTGVYHLEEKDSAKIPGYSFAVNYENGQTFTLNSNSMASRTIKNVYTRYALSVKKNVTGTYPYTNTVYAFAVLNTNTNKYINTAGEEINNGIDPYCFTITDGETVEVALKNPGNYKVVEKNENVSENVHFDLVTTYEVTGDPTKSEVAINDTTKTGEITITNDYTYKHEGSLEIVKNITGDGYDPDKTYPITVEFDSPVAYSVNGAAPITKPSTTYSTSIKAGAANSVTLSKIPVGTKCRVIEGASALTDGYSLVNIEYYDGNTKIGEVSSDYDQASAFITLTGDGVEHKAVVNNKYEKAKINITKTIYGVLSNLSTADKNNLTFVVNDQDGTEIWRGNLGDTSKFTISDPGNGYYVSYKSVDIPVTDLSKSYTVTEILTNASGMNIFVVYTINGSDEQVTRRNETNRDPIKTKTFTLNPGEVKTIEFKDTYHVYDVKVVKHVEGTDARDQLFKIVVEFTPPTNGTIDWDSVLILNPYERDGASYTVDRNTNTVTCYLKGDQYINIRRLPVGATYDAHEDLTGISNYVMSKEIEYCDSKKKVDDLDYGPDCIDVYNKYEETKCNVTISKKALDVAGNELPGATLTLTGVDGTTAIDLKSLVTSGAVTVDYGTGAAATTGYTGNGIQFKSGTKATEIKNLPNGTYTLKETAVPEGSDYEVSTDIVFTVENGKITDATVQGKNNVDKDSGLITMVDDLAKTGNLKVTKTKAAGSDEIAATAKFEITIDLTVPAGKDLSKVTVTGGTLSGTKVTANLAVGESVTIENLPENTTYAVNETAVAD
ncbi:MAG: hypothetical protein IKD90_01270, partial [Clostridiales bacterium]|nr:hypothetical protein [Clostridiales bacterium]